VVEPWGAHIRRTLKGTTTRDNEFYIGCGHDLARVRRLSHYLDEFVYGVRDRAEYMQKQPRLAERLKAGRAAAAPESITVSDYTADEMMAVVAARELADGEGRVRGHRPANLAGNLARRTHAPRLVSDLRVRVCGRDALAASRLDVGDPRARQPAR